MSSDGDAETSPNGTSRVVSNGSHGQPPGSSAASTTNGTLKAASSNGTSRRNGKEVAKETPSDYHGHDREEVTRILIQALADMGHRSAAESVSQDSGFELESPTVAAFRASVLGGQWDEAEKLLFGHAAAATSSDPSSQTGSGLPLAQGADRNLMRFWLRQQKFLEFKEQGDSLHALRVLRTELTTLNQDPQKIQFLSNLLMCASVEDLKVKAKWDGADGTSRQALLSELSKCISPSVMLPEHRLAVLLDQVRERQIMNCTFHTSPITPSLYSDHICDRSLFPTGVIHEINMGGEVWQIRFSHDGNRLAACGAPTKVAIYEIAEGSSAAILHMLDGHEDGVGNVAWSPDDSMLVSCGRDRVARIWDTHDGSLIRELPQFAEPVSSCVWAADGQSFVLGSFDKYNALCQWSLQGQKLHTWNEKNRTEDLAVSPDGHWLVAMDDLQHIYVYNFMTRELKYDMALGSRPTSLSISHDSRYLLVNTNITEALAIDLATRKSSVNTPNAELILFDLANRNAVQRYSGHSGGEYLIRSDFGGAHESFIICGSEDGFIYVWHKTRGDAIAKLSAHQPRCNAIAWSPTNPVLFASAGDDGKIKLWSSKTGLQSGQDD